MAPADENNDNSSIQQAAKQHATEILNRRRAARATRAAALAAHREPISIKTELTHFRLTAAGTSETVSQVPTDSQTAGYLLAVGDSWFDYPIEDVLTKLEDNYGYNIESTAHRGDPIETMVSHVGQLDKFARCMDKIRSFGANPKAILISGGGDDIAGEEFGMLINNIDLHIGAWNEQAVAGVIDTRIAAAYRMMFASLNAICQQDVNRTFPILVHGYDHPVPDGRGFLGGWGPLPGPWLKPGFDEKLYNDLGATTQLMAALIDRFNTMLQNLVKEPGVGEVHYVDLRGTLSNASNNYRDFWANELHPTGGELIGGGSDGFKAVAAKFQAVLSQLPTT
jgi:hypothetical protein